MKLFVLDMLLITVLIVVIVVISFCIYKIVTSLLAYKRKREMMEAEFLERMENKK